MRQQDPLGRDLGNESWETRTMVCPPLTRCSLAEVMFAYGSNAYAFCHDTNGDQEPPWF